MGLEGRMKRGKGGRMEGGEGWTEGRMDRGKEPHAAPAPGDPKGPGALGSAVLEQLLPCPQEL